MMNGIIIVGILAPWVVIFFLIWELDEIGKTNKDLILLAEEFKNAWLKERDYLVRVKAAAHTLNVREKGAVYNIPSPNYLCNGWVEILKIVGEKKL